MKNKECENCGFTPRSKLILRDGRMICDLCFTADYAKELAGIIKRVRMEKGITQVKLAELLQTPQSVVARAERGDFLPSVTFLYKIAKALGLNLKITFI